MQGNLTSSMIFSIVMDAVMKAVLEVFCGPQEAKHGMGWAAEERNLVFYDNKRWIQVREQIRVQDALTVTLVMFRRVGLEINLEKTKALVCTPG